MKLNQHIPPTISSALDLNVSGFWISSFNLSKHPREGAYGMKWLTEFHYKGLSDSCLQLSRFNMLVGFDLCQDYGHRDVCRMGFCSTLWPLYNFISTFAPADSPECTCPLTLSHAQHQLIVQSRLLCIDSALSIFFSYADFDINIWHLVHGLPSSCNLWLRKSKVFCLGGSCIFVVPFGGRFP